MDEDQKAVFPTEPDATIASDMMAYDNVAMYDFVEVLDYLVKSFSEEYSGEVGPERDFGDTPEKETQLTLSEEPAEEFPDDELDEEEELQERGLIEVRFGGELLLEYRCTFPTGLPEERAKEGLVISNAVTDALADWLTRSAALDPKLSPAILEGVQHYLKRRAA